MEFRILGPLEVWEADRALHLGGAKHRALLAILLLEANRVVSTDRLIELLWGDEPPETVGNTLQVCVSQLRKVLEPGHVRGTPYRLLVSQEPGYLIRVAPDQLDLRRFEQLREEARQASSDGYPDTAAALLREALGLWRGPPLADIAAEPYAMAEANRLNEMRMHAVEDRIEADLALGRHGELVGELEALVSEHPLRERFRAQLMLALYRSGRQAEASGVFHKTRSVLVEEVGIEPGTDLQRLLKAILNQDPALDLAPEMSPRRRPRNTNLPLQLTSFVGRVIEVADVKRLISQARSLTLVGPGGVGKTRLAIQAADELAGEFREGAWLIELASLTEPSLVPQSIANSLGIREQAGVPIIDTIILFLERRHILLVLDNCEHLIDASARLVDKLLRVCPSVRVLATSREPLRVAGEILLSVRPLTVPAVSSSGTIDELDHYEAVRLFCERAATAVTSFVPNQETLTAVAEICRQLDGIPLAIELAAATLRMLPAEQIAARLDHRFRILTDGHRTALPRQQTLEASIDWSYDLLSAPEKTLFPRLSVFSGDFSLEAAEAICVGQPIDAEAIFGLLRSLVSKSLVVLVPVAADTRYGLLETVRQYAEERLSKMGEVSAVSGRHLDWYLALAERAMSALHGPDQASWLGRLSSEHMNLRKALRSAAQAEGHAALRLARALTFFWMMRGHFTEGREWLRLALEIRVDPPARARTLTSAGMLAVFQGNYVWACEALSESCRLQENLDDPRDLSQALSFFGLALSSRGDTSEGLALMERSVLTAAKAGETWELAATLNHLGLFTHLFGDQSSRPRILLENSLRVAREVGDAWISELILDSLAQVAMDHMDLESARSYWQECIDITLRLGEKFGIPYFLEGFARVASAQAQHGRTLRLLGAASSLRSQTGNIPTPIERGPVQLTLSRAREALDDAESNLAWHEGAAMTLQEAIDYALGGAATQVTGFADEPTEPAFARTNESK